MTRSIIRSGESLNNLGSLSQDWFRQVEQSEGWSLHRKVKAIDDALQIAERFCATVSCPLTVLVERASGRISSTEKFLNIPQALTKSIDMKCRDIGVDSTRYTAKSRAKWGVELVRFIATLSPFRRPRTPERCC